MSLAEERLAILGAKARLESDSWQLGFKAAVGCEVFPYTASAFADTIQPLLRRISRKPDTRF